MLRFFGFPLFKIILNPTISLHCLDYKVSISRFPVTHSLCAPRRGDTGISRELLKMKTLGPHPTLITTKVCVSQDLQVIVVYEKV